MGEDLDIQCPYHLTHDMRGAPLPPLGRYGMMEPPHHVPPFSPKHNSLLQGMTMYVAIINRKLCSCMYRRANYLQGY